MRISDWSSDVCSSDLFLERGGRALDHFPGGNPVDEMFGKAANCGHDRSLAAKCRQFETGARRNPPEIDRKSVVSGKSVSVRVDLGGRRILKKKTYIITCSNIYCKNRYTHKHYT